MKPTGNLSRDLRTQLELSVSEWARAFGVPERTVRRWEDGMKPSGVASEVLRAIEDALKHGAVVEIVAARITGGLTTLVYNALTTAR